MEHYALLDDNGRIIAHFENACEAGLIEFCNAEILYNRNEFYRISDFKIIDNMAVLEPCEETIKMIEQAEKQKQIEELPEAVADIQDALVEVAEMTANNEVSMADVQDALVELAGMVSELIGE